MLSPPPHHHLDICHQPPPPPLLHVPTCRMSRLSLDRSRTCLPFTYCVLSRYSLAQGLGKGGGGRAAIGMGRWLDNTPRGLKSACCSMRGTHFRAFQPQHMHSLAERPEGAPMRSCLLAAASGAPTPTSGPRHPPTCTGSGAAGRGGPGLGLRRWAAGWCTQQARSTAGAGGGRGGGRAGAGEGVGSSSI